MNDDIPVLYEVDGPVAIVTLNRPKQLNAINRAMRAGFREAFERVAADDNVHAVLLRGAGERAFSSGADLKEIGNRTPMQRRMVANEEPSTVVRGCDKPVIASVRGYAFGGGLELALACDIRVASRNSTFCFPEISHGWFPAAGGTQALPRLVGMAKAMELILSGRRATADEGLAIGLVNELCDDSDLDARSIEMAQSIGRHKLGALVLAKAALRMSERTGSDIGNLYERELGALSYTLEGRAEALSAFAARSKKKSGSST